MSLWNIRITLVLAKDNHKYYNFVPPAKAGVNSNFELKRTKNFKL
jgi:hypothetical protein